MYMYTVLIWLKNCNLRYTSNQHIWLNKMNVTLKWNLVHDAQNFSVGAVLIFLPGYDDIVTLREAIGDSKSMDKFR